ncbi:I/LWEQ domain-containing protein [Planoprotostelium fungivorum]|uniref:I/LWEQ domain-containing protein n=1 Tax=Planoprotostelium fungivorum TaxID=1890364 RepID=A0A2P6MYD0_9EUKA|nr:I/LWEQ domain-containing protein [Planoprotostelium fungivorum]
MSDYKQESVKKACKSKAVPPKRKHVRNLVIEAHKDGGGNTFFNEVFRKPLERDEIAAWKALVVCHHVMSEGPRGVLDDASYRSTTFEGLRSMYGRNNVGIQGTKHYSVLIETYANFILDKIKFHQAHPEFPNDFKLETFLKHKDSRDQRKNLSALTHMSELQASICRMGNKIFEGKDLIDCKTACLIPLVIESYNIYTLCTHLIRNLVDEMDDMEVLGFLIEQFYAQYITLKNWFYDCSGVKYVTSVIAVPTLPQDPPEFFGRRKMSRTSSKPPAPQPTPAPAPAPAPKPAPPVSTFDPFASMAPAPQPVYNYNPQPVYNPPPPAGPNPFYQPQVAATPAQWVTFGEASPFGMGQAVSAGSSTTTGQTQIKSVANDLSGLVSLVKTQTQSEVERRKTDVDAKRREEEERRKKEADLKAAQELELQKKREEQRKRDEARKKAEDEKRKAEEAASRREAERIKQEKERKEREEERIRVEQERIRKITLEESSNEIKELKMRIVELERLLAAEREKNKANEETIADLQATIVNLKNQLTREREELQEELKTDKAIIAERDALISRMRAKYSEVKTAFDAVQKAAQTALRAEIRGALDALSLLLSTLDSPTNLGNENATIENITTDASEVEAAITAVLMASASGSEHSVATALRDYARVCGTLFDDCKGYSRSVEDNESRQRLLDTVRSVGASLSGLLSTVNGVGGLAKDEKDRKQLQDEAANVSAKLKLLLEASQKTEKVIDESGADLEELAEQELLAAARVIEQAAANLIAAKQAAKNINTTVPAGVADAILEAAMAITKATSLLVTAAAAAQKERVDKGKNAPAGYVYRRDPRWSQGLISAAKSVAHSTQMMITTASDVAHGKIEEENVIAASKAVASSTAQLVAATKAKADDPNSAAQVKVSTASRAVTNATAQLVEAARAASIKNEEEDMDDIGSNPIQRKIKEMELQTHILKLEKELGLVRNKLFALRKQEYAGSATTTDIASAALPPPVMASPITPQRERSNTAGGSNPFA